MVGFSKYSTEVEKVIVIMQQSLKSKDQNCICNQENIYLLKTELKGCLM